MITMSFADFSLSNVDRDANALSCQKQMSKELSQVELQRKQEGKHSASYSNANKGYISTKNKKEITKL